MIDVNILDRLEQWAQKILDWIANLF